MIYDFTDLKKSEKLPELILNFLNYLETIKGKSPNTIDAYKIDLSLFLRFLKVYREEVSDIEFDQVDISKINDEFIKSVKLSELYAFMSFLEKYRNNSAYARARKVATLKSFFKYLQNKVKLIDDNPTLELESPKINKRHPVYLNLDQSITLLNSLNKKNKNYARDFCIITFFLNCGMRLSELCNIELDKIKGDTLTIIGKGNKERTVYLNDACLYALNEYLKIRDTSKTDLDNLNYLFLSNRGNKINKRTVEIMVKKSTLSAGLKDQKYTPHKLRHTAATLMYKHGDVDIRALQSILGHESISTTQIYTHVDDETLREAVKRNPLSHLQEKNKS